MGGKQKNSSPNANKEPSGFGQLLAACAQGNLAEVQRLIEAGVDQNQFPGAPRGWSPLIMASFHGHLPIAKFLVQSGAKLDSLEIDGWATALDFALEKGHSQVASYLRSVGAPLGKDIPNPYRGGKLGGWVEDRP